MDVGRRNGGESMKQQTFSDIEYSGRKRKTKREKFLDKMDEIIPWGEWVAYIVVNILKENGKDLMAVFS